MSIFLQILGYTLPALVVFLTTWLVLRKQLDNETDRRNFELRRLSANQITPVRLRAYERLTLLLERTQPEAMILRLDLQGMTNIELQSKLLQTIRTEFDHNVAQQIYVSPEAWAMVKNARENLVRVINGAAAQVQPTGAALQLAQKLIELYSSLQTTPTEAALNCLKNEVKTL